MTTTEPNTMIRTLETVSLGGTPKISLWQCFILMVIMIFISGVLICASTPRSAACDTYGTFTQKESCKVLDAYRYSRHREYKMSKSTGNAIYVRDLLKKFDANTLKLYFYSLDYKRIINFKISELIKFEGINTMIRNIVSTSEHENKNYDTRNHNVADSKELEADTYTLKRFNNYIDNDLDTPNALALFLQTVVDPNKMNEARKMMKIFGLEY